MDLVDFDAYADFEDQRESDFPLTRIQTALVWRRLEGILTGARLRVLDAGAGTGRYSLPLAERGHEVTHFDCSERALELARVAAGELPLRFVLGDILELSGFADRGFDLTLCFDAPLSFVAPQQERALDELCRVTAGRIAILTSARAGMVRDALIWDLERRYLPEDETDQGLEPFIYARRLLREGRMDWPSNWAEHLRNQGLDLMPDFGFWPEDLEAGLQRRGFEVEDSRAIGALASGLSDEALSYIAGDPARLEDFLALEEELAARQSLRAWGGPNLLVIAQRAATQS